MNTRKIVHISLFACAALAIYALESLLPPLIPVPGAKLGLANIITLVAIYSIGKKEAFAVLMLRIIMSSLLFGQIMSFAFSLAGGIMCYLAICVSVRFLERSQLWATGIIGALAHNIGQIAVAIAVTSQLSVAYYFLVLVIASIISGAFTGLCAAFSLKIMDKIK